EASALPQPGASQESFIPFKIGPSGQGAADLAHIPYGQENPFSRTTDASGSSSSSPKATVPGGAAHAASDIPYFLAENPWGAARPGEPRASLTPDIPRDVYPATPLDGAAIAPATPP